MNLEQLGRAEQISIQHEHGVEAYTRKEDDCWFQTHPQRGQPMGSDVLLERIKDAIGVEDVS
jgi:hypothetical protein